MLTDDNRNKLQYRNEMTSNNDICPQREVTCLFFNCKIPQNNKFKGSMLKYLYLLWFHEEYRQIFVFKNSQTLYQKSNIGWATLQV